MLGASIRHPCARLLAASMQSVLPLLLLAPSWYLQARAQDDSLRDSSEEPEDQLPSQTPAVGLLAAAAAAASGPQFTAPTAAGAKLQTGLLRSLQHRFATQQALETPAGLAGAAGDSNQPQQQQQHLAALEEDEEEEEEDGFQIFSQLTYEPTFLSQRPAELGSEAPAGQATAGLVAGVADTSQQATQTQLLPCSQQGAQPAAAVGRPAATAAAAAEEEDGDDGLDWPSSQLLSQHQQQEDALRRASGVSAASHKTTPALHSSERVQCDGVGPSGACCRCVSALPSTHASLIPACVPKAVEWR